MPRHLLPKFAAALAALLAVLTLLPARHALAVDSSWNVNAAGNWNTTGNWTAGVPNAIDDIARLTYNITAPRTVTINTSSRTVGSLYLNDDNYGYILAGLALKLDVSSGSALIQSDGGTGVTHTISAPVSLYDATTIAVNSATLQISGAISSGVSGTGVTKTGVGTLVLSSTNTFSGPTVISAGALRATSGVGLPAASNLVLAGSVLEGSGVTTFTRSLGTSGSNTVQWTGSGGFSASGGMMTVAIGGTASPTALTWGSGNFVPLDSALIFGSTSANGETQFKNNINLAGGTRTIIVNDNPASTADFATITGALSNGGLIKDGLGMLRLASSSALPSGAGLTVMGGGTLDIGANNFTLGTVTMAGGAITGTTGVLTAAAYDLRKGTISVKLAGSTDLTKTTPDTVTLSASNTYTGQTTISGGALQATIGTGIRSTSFISLDGGVFQSSGTFTRSLGTSGSTFQWTGNGGGFAAAGGTFTVNIGGNPTPKELVWDTTVGTNIVGPLMFGSSTADNQIEFRNPIDLSGATRTFDVTSGTGGDSALLSGVIRSSTGMAGILKTGTGTLVLSGNNTFTGGATVSGGTLRFTADNLAGVSNVTVQSGGTLDLQDCDIAGKTVTLSGGLMTSSCSESSWAGPVILAADSKFNGYLTVSGIISDSGLGCGVEIGNPNPYWGTLISLTGASYTGLTKVTGGLLNAVDGVGLPTASNLVLAGGTYQSNGPAVFTRSLGTSGLGTVCWTGSGGFSAGGGKKYVGGGKMIVAIGGTDHPTPLVWGEGGFVPVGSALKFGDLNSFDGETEFRNAIDLAGGIRTVSVHGNETYMFGYETAILSGVISNGGLVVDGGGTLVLTGQNTYAGQTTIKAKSTLRAVDGVGLPTATNLTIENGYYEGDGPTILTRSLGATGANTIQWTTSNTGGLSAHGGKLTVALGGLANPTPLVWGVGGFLQGSGQSYLMFGSPTGDSETELRNDIDLGGKERFVEVNDAHPGSFATLSGVISNGTLYKCEGGTLVLTGANTYTGETSIGGGALEAADGVGLPAASNLVLRSGVFQGRGPTVFTRGIGASGSNTVRWSGSGGFSASGGKMTVAIGGTSSPTPLVWASGSFVASYLLFGSSTADSETEFRNDIDLAGAARTILVYDNPDTTGDFATISGVLSNGSIIKKGDGLLVLKGSQTYTGPTSINEGNLIIDAGGTLASSLVTVANEATLGGSGTIAGSVDVQPSGVVAPGASPGILTVNAITFADNSTLAIELGGLARGTEYDVLAASGTLTLQSGSGLAVTLINGFVPQGGDEFDILDFAGVSGAFNAPNLPALGGGLSWDTSDLYTSGTILVAPEPASAAMLIAGVVCTLLRRRAK